MPNEFWNLLDVDSDPISEKDMLALIQIVWEQGKELRMPVGLNRVSDYDGPFYAGIGSRSTPGKILMLMRDIGVELAYDGYVLRSGHAPGADQAFEQGAGGLAEIFLPWQNYESGTLIKTGSHVSLTPPKIAYEIAADFHPAWDRLSEPVRKLHARNVQQIFGPTCDEESEPVEFVICWTPDGKASGGTGQAIRVAEAFGIPVRNLRDPEQYRLASEWIDDIKKTR